MKDLRDNFDFQCPRRTPRRPGFVVEPLERRVHLSVGSPGILRNVAVTTDPGVQQMPSVAADPRDPNHVVIAYMDRALVATGYAGIGAAVSRDAGDTWQKSVVPLPHGFDQGAAEPVATSARSM